MADARFDGGNRRLLSRLHGPLGTAPAALLLGRRAGLAGIGRRTWLDSRLRRLDIGCVVDHRTNLNSRFQRTETGQRQNIQACSPSAMEKKIIWARPTMFSNGT